MFYRKVILITIFLIVLLSSTGMAQLPTNPEKGSIAVGLDRIVNDTGWNLLTAVPYDFNGANGYIAGIMQGGDIIRGKYHAEIGVDVSVFRLVLFTKGTVKGYSFETLGRDYRYGFGADTPDIKGVSLRIGIFGVNADHYGPPNAYQTLENNNYDPSTFEGLGLKEINPPASGLSFNAGNFVNLLVETRFSIRGISAKIAGMPQLTGENKAHQLINSFYINKALGRGFSLDIGAELGLQYFNEQIENETAYFIGLSTEWNSII